jgi:hypothetical protein
MKVFDTVNNVELEADTKKLVDIMVDGRQVDVYLKEKKSDEDGYMSWDVALVSNRQKAFHPLLLSGRSCPQRVYWSQHL